MVHNFGGDPARLLLAAQRGHQRTAEIECAAYAAGGDDAAVHHAGALERSCPRHAILHTRIAGGLTTLEQPHAAQNNRRCSADCGNVFAFVIALAHRVCHTLVRIQILRAWHTARQHHHIRVIPIRLIHGQIGLDADAVRAVYQFACHTYQFDLDACAAQQIGRRNGFRLFKSLC